ncbi:hypothetical protein U9M48_035790 [Paspalum notatum var. saurae]|uniref:CCHC-type domain-containing protein n=1 Tax=Paspalum notatum var. saurae TaxID=547442 RepID=A0AAQ3UG48_PASNO
MRDSLACTGSKSLTLATPSSESVTNPMLHNFSFSALMSVTEEQLATLGDDELCLVSSRFQRAYDNRMSKKRGERPKCFECGEVGHFIAECPNKNDYYKKGKSYSRDSDKYHSGKAGFDKHRSSKHGSGKRPFGKKNFRKAFKSYQKDNRKRDKDFFAKIGFYSSGSSSSSSSSSSSDEEITYRKDKRNDQGGPAGLCFVSTKSRRRNKEKRSLVCSMALEDKKDKDDGSNSSSDDEDRGMDDVWIMDSGCSRHMTGHRKWFSSLNPMSREFEMSLMGELQFFLGLQIKQGLEGTFVHQAKYTRDILKKFNMGDSKPMTTPMSTNTALDADEDEEAMDQKEFRGMIGSLLYVTATRPASPRTSHLQAVKRIFRYLKFTPEFGLWYSLGSSLSLRGFSDADHAGCRIDRKSTSGTCQLLETSLVSWSSRKQASVALSTTEAEYVAAASCYSQLLWMKATLSDFGLRFGRIRLLVDSTSAISVAKNPVLHSRTKHIDVRFHFLRDHYEKGDIELIHVVSANQLADIFTKPLELQVEGIDNALIKGEIESQWTGLIALMV